MSAPKPLTVLGIETSCDETAASVVRGHPAFGAPATILSNVIAQQIEEHAPFGGVVPELAARAHISHLDTVIARALADAGLALRDVDAIAATAGPGLIGGVIVGLMTAKGLALGAQKPLIPVNHLEGHALTARLVGPCPFPYLLLLVSGGHSAFVLVEDVGRCQILGETIDDAVGESFDKTAKLLGLGFPGGPAVEELAKSGNPRALAFPRPLLDRDGLDLSLAGLKTAVRYAAGDVALLTREVRADICASFQEAVAAILEARTQRALAQVAERFRARDNLRFVVAGGVASNKLLRARLEAVCHRAGATFIAPPAKLCTDNGAMIAWAGLERLARGAIPADALSFAPRARWPLDEAA